MSHGSGESQVPPGSPHWTCCSREGLLRVSALPWGGPRTEQGWCSSARPSGGCRAAAPRGGVCASGQPRCQWGHQEQGPGNCPEGREMTEKIHIKQPGKSAGTPPPQSCAGGIGVGQVQSRSRWKDLLRDVPRQGLQISKDGNPTAPSQLPSQNYFLTLDIKDLRQ